MKYAHLCSFLILAASQMSTPRDVQGGDPIPVIYDTDIGNDVDDVQALAVLHALQTRGKCRLVAVTITKDHPQCAAFVDAVNTFYGRGQIPIGVCRSGVTTGQSKFTGLAAEPHENGLRYPHDLRSGADAPDAVTVLRETLAAEKDDSVVIAQVGFSTNLAELLDSGPDTHSSLSGTELVKSKVRLLSVMAGAFEPVDGRVHLEYNVVKDIPAAQKLAKEWPGRIVYSGFEIGLAAKYPAESIEQDYNYVTHHPVREAYYLYNPPPHNRPTWDLTSVLFGILPNRDYFDLSPPGNVVVAADGETKYAPASDGTHQYLIMSDAQRERVVEALVQLSSQPPQQLGSIRQQEAGAN